MLKTKDHENYDYIEIIVKKENAEQVISAYRDFLWKEISRKEDKRYHDIVHIGFCRARDIQNKDRLQLLQVYYEFALNERADLFEKKHRKSNAGICNLAVFATVLLVGLWLLIFYIKTLPIFLGGIVLTSIIASLVFFFSGKIKNLRKRENEKFKIKEDETTIKINEILGEVKSLTKEGGEL